MKTTVMVTAILLAAACSSATKGSGPSAHADRSLLNTEEIARAGAQDAYTAVQTLRPHWLSVRGASSFRQGVTVKVYLDGNLMGGPENLRQITTSSIREIRYMDGLEATQRYGLDHGQGAILVSTRVEP